MGLEIPLVPLINLVKSRHLLLELILVRADASVASRVMACSAFFLLCFSHAELEAISGIEKHGLGMSSHEK